MTQDEIMEMWNSVIKYAPSEVRITEFANLVAAKEREALAQPEQEPVAYDKTEMNCFVQDLYDKKMKEGKHGHYETMFHVVHQAIKRVPPQRTWVGLAAEDRLTAKYMQDAPDGIEAVIDYIEAKLKEKNT